MYSLGMSLPLEIVFKFLTFTPGPLWITLFFFPKNRTAMLVFDAFLWIAAGLFAVQAAPDLAKALPIIASPTLDGVVGMFSTRESIVLAWNHFIIADLWIGRWIAHDCVRLGVGGWMRVPLLFVVLFFGPLGLFVYLIFRALKYREWGIYRLETESNLQ
jgi:hypothetical protein